MAPTKRRDVSEWIFSIVDRQGFLVTTVHVSADDINEARANYCYASYTNRDVAVDLYEHRFESALSKAGLTYDDAIARGCHLAASSNG